MSSTGAARPPAQLVALIGAITVIPLITLLWLGWRLREQDRLLERQQVQQRVERGADLLVAGLQRAIAATEERLASGVGAWPEGAVAAVFHDDTVDVSPRGRAAYVPRVRAGPEAPASAFAHGEDLEFRQRDLDGAVAVFRQLAKMTDPAIQAGALVRLARNLQKAGRPDEALEAYARLAAADDAWLDGVPAGLIGRYGRCKLLDKLQRADELRTEAANLEAALRAGRWRLTPSVYWLYSADAAQWTGSRSAQAKQSETYAEALAVVWDRWGSTNPTPAASGRDVIEANGQPFVVLWQKRDALMRVLVVSPAFVQSEWLSLLAPILKDTSVTLALQDSGSRLLVGSVNGGGGRTVRSAADSSLPFAIVAASMEPPPEARAFAVRRRLLASGLVLLVFMAVAASYLIVRAVSREYAVARLQSDFVAAVSHEFRTPLTSLRQFTDMLRENPSLSDERRRVVYDAQSRATDRLIRLVESLLDFGRMQAGARRYRFEPHDCTELVRSVVDDFRPEAAASGHAIDFRGNGTLPLAIDEEALSRAVRNLLDNAVKYSPEPRPIEVVVSRLDGAVVIAVKDRGIGIPAQEQGAIFSKFHRGEQARTRGIKGTGIGLAMVDEIVRAHQGRIEVASEPGHGSTFTIVLPAEASA